MKITLTLIVLVTIATSSNLFVEGFLSGIVGGVVGGVAKTINNLVSSVVCGPIPVLIGVLYNDGTSLSLLDQLKNMPSFNALTVQQGHKVFLNSVNQCQAQIKIIADAANCQRDNQRDEIVAALGALKNILSDCKPEVQKLPSNVLLISQIDSAIANCQNLSAQIKKEASISAETASNIKNFCDDMPQVLSPCIKSYVDFHSKNIFDGPAQDIAQNSQTTSFNMAWNNHTSVVLTKADIVARECNSAVRNMITGIAARMTNEGLVNAVDEAIAQCKFPTDCYEELDSHWSQIIYDCDILKQDLIDPIKNEGIGMSDIYAKSRADLSGFRTPVVLSASDIVNAIRAKGLKAMGCFRDQFPQIHVAMTNVGEDYERCCRRSRECLETIIADIKAKLELFFLTAKECVDCTKTPDEIQSCWQTAFEGVTVEVKSYIENLQCLKGLNDGLKKTGDNVNLRTTEAMIKFNSCTKSLAENL